MGLHEYSQNLVTKQSVLVCLDSGTDSLPFGTSMVLLTISQLLPFGWKALIVLPSVDG